MYGPQNQYRVVLEVDPKFQDDPRALDKVFVRAADGQMVPLSSIAHYEVSNVPLAVNHQGQFAAVTISFNLAPGVSLERATQVIDASRARAESSGHASAAVSPGTPRFFRNSVANQPILILAALIAVYIVLGMLYESLIHPITILSTLPSAGLGALLALQFFGFELSIVAMIGIILLIGIVKKNAIMMVDFALEAQRSRSSESGGSHLSGVPRSLSPNHDDDAGRLVRGIAFGHRPRSRFRTSPPPRNRHRRRPDRLSSSYALYDSGRVLGIGAASVLGAEVSSYWRAGSRNAR